MDHAHLLTLVNMLKNGAFTDATVTFIGYKRDTVNTLMCLDGASFNGDQEVNSTVSFPGETYLKGRTVSVAVYESEETDGSVDLNLFIER